MFALLRQLAKLLLLVFNLPAVLNILSSVFSVSVKNGRLELGIVDLIARSVITSQTQNLRLQILEGKDIELQNLTSETEALENLYNETIDDPETRQFFIQSARRRQLRRKQELENLDPSSIITDTLIDQMVKDKKDQLEPSIVPALVPITAFLGIPIMIQKLAEYVPGLEGLTNSLTSKDLADQAGDQYTSEFEDEEGEIFNGVVSEEGSTLEITFFGIFNSQDYKIFTKRGEGDIITLDVTSEDSQSPYTVQITNYGALDNTKQGIRDLFTIEQNVPRGPILSDPRRFNIVVEPTPSYGGPLKERVLRSWGFGEDGILELIVTSADRKVAIVKIPMNLSLKRD